MVTTSPAWKTNQNQIFVDESFVEIAYDVTDPVAVLDATATDNGTIFIGNTPQIVSGLDTNIVRYATLERNICVLDGSFHDIPASNFGDTGYISQTMSNEAGDFTSTTIVNINFSVVHTKLIPGITITWATTHNEFAESFIVSVFNGAALQATRHITNNQSIVSIVEMDIVNFNRIQIEILKWCLPRKRARITEVFVGIRKTYTKVSLMGYEHELEVDPLSTKLSKTSVKFEVDNTLDTYNPINPVGQSRFIMERQRVQARYGFKLGEVIEWIPGGVFYMSEWEAPQNGISASFEARDILDLMRDVYRKGVYSATGVSLHSLALAVLNEANLPLNRDGSVKWVIDPSLINVFTNAPLPLLAMNDCLIRIANAGGCVLVSDRQGNIHIRPISTIPVDYVVNSFNSLRNPEIALGKPLAQVNVNTYSYTPEGTATVIFNGVVNVIGTQFVWIEYQNPATNVSAMVTGGTLVSAQYFTYTCLLTITANGNVTITVNGNVLRVTKNIVTINTTNIEGDTFKIDNPLITSTQRALSTGQLARDYLMNRKIVSSDWRADPSVDVLDIITTTTKYASSNTRLTSVNFKYNGAFRGTSEGRIVI